MKLPQKVRQIFLVKLGGSRKAGHKDKHLRILYFKLHRAKPAQHRMNSFGIVVGLNILKISIRACSELLFTYLFGGAVSAALAKGANYLNYVVPGILLMSIGYCATTAATSINNDMAKGIVGRFKTMPIARSDFIIGHIFSALIRKYRVDSICNWGGASHRFSSHRHPFRLV